MKDFVKPGNTITVPAPAGGAKSGAGVLVGSIFGVAAYDAAEGDPVEIMLDGVHMLDKTNAQAWTIGLLIYWDNTTKKVTSAASGNKLIGASTEAAANPSADGMVRLNGAFTS
ncbi:DUF2190 family protein [Afifella aestuarii]|uniref:DUF2190 family protein n=1 Tax=Afifella aestuarii TaxID=1909496 RepID=UPI000FE3FF6D|nr:DUF2190 family protein [Afifella aestuarii]